ncbi:uncharacterized protein Osi4 isoform X2 [Drosophila montana]|uniref:uncharacterized protein Osi4 isoform X2 n=1 Tax=Drosophila montana TaxID=40370 RepID=UPI00313B21F4
MLQYIAASCALLALLCAPPNSAAIHKRSGARAANALGTEAEATPTTRAENTDLLDKLSWKCANNASCLHSVANGIAASYRRGETIKLGLFDLVRLPPLDEAHRHKWGTGRALSSFMDFVSGNAIRVPVGPMVFSVQRAEDDSDYIEVALLKKASSGTGVTLVAQTMLLKTSIISRSTNPIQSKLLLPPSLTPTTPTSTHPAILKP